MYQTILFAVLLLIVIYLLYQNYTIQKELNNIKKNFDELYNFLEGSIKKTKPKIMDTLSSINTTDITDNIITYSNDVRRVKVDNTITTEDKDKNTKMLIKMNNNNINQDNIKKFNYDNNVMDTLEEDDDDDDNIDDNQNIIKQLSNQKSANNKKMIDDSNDDNDNNDNDDDDDDEDNDDEDNYNESDIMVSTTESNSIKNKRNDNVKLILSNIKNSLTSELKKSNSSSVKSNKSKSSIIISQSSRKSSEQKLKQSSEQKIHQSSEQKIHQSSEQKLKQSSEQKIHQSSEQKLSENNNVLTQSEDKIGKKLKVGRKLKVGEDITLETTPNQQITVLFDNKSDTNKNITDIQDVYSVEQLNKMNINKIKEVAKKFHVVLSISGKAKAKEQLISDIMSKIPK